MRTPAPSLLPLFRSRVQGGLLALLYLHPDQSYSLADIARRIGVSGKAVHVEANRLSRAGYINESRLGHVRLLTANTSSVVFRPLRDLLALTYGPLPILSELLGDRQDVHAAYIFGSWARRYHGDPGPPPNDVDVVVVGTIDPDQLYEIGRAASTLLGHEVHAVRVSRSAWESSDDAFVANVRGGALVDLLSTTPSELSEVAQT